MPHTKNCKKFSGKKIGKKQRNEKKESYTIESSVYKMRFLRWSEIMIDLLD